MKGISLSINTMIILLIGVVVLIAILYTFTDIFTTSMGGVSLEAAKNTACQRLVSIGCDVAYPENIIINGFDADKDGEPDADTGYVWGDHLNAASHDNLAALCENYYFKTQDNCIELCGCQPV